MRRTRLPACWRRCRPATARWWSTTTAPTQRPRLRAGAVPRWCMSRSPGYGSAVHAGVVAAATPIVAVLDADGSMDPGELPGWSAALGPRRRPRGRPAPTGAGVAMAVARPARQRRGVLAAAAQARAGGARHRPDAGGPPGGPAGARCDGPPIGVSGRTAGPRRRRGLAGGRTRRRLRAPYGRQIQGQRFGARQPRSPRWTSGRPSRDRVRRPAGHRPGGGQGAGARAGQDAAGAPHSAITPPPISPPPRCWTRSTRWRPPRRQPASSR